MNVCGVNKKNVTFFTVCMIMICLCYFLFTVIFRYEDTISFTAWSVEFWDCLFNGNGISDYYTYSNINVREAFHGVPAGSWLTFFPWIIWNFPLYLTHVEPTSEVIGQVCIVWSKGLLLVSLFAMSVYIYKIVMRLTRGNSTVSLYAILLTCGSLELFDSIAYTGQDEIIYLCFFVMAVFYMMKGKKITALIFSIMSVTVCPIMIIPVFFLIAVYHDKLYSIIFANILCLLPTFLFEVLYRNDQIYNSVKEMNTIGTFQLMMNASTFPSAIGPVSVAALIMVLLAFWLLFVKNESEKDRKAITVLAIVFTCMCFFMATTFYRSCIYIPFVVMFACMNSELFAYKSLMLLVVSICRFLFFITNDYNLATRYLTGFVSERFKTLPDQIINPASIGYDCAIYIFRVFAFAAIILFFTIHFIAKKIEMKKFISERTAVFIYSLSLMSLVVYFFCAIL